MAKILTRGTALERALRAVLDRLGTGPVILNDCSLPGSPDAVLPGARTALFAHGCFWHHHAGCPCARLPATSYAWAAKFRRNRARDLANRDDLLRQGWRVGWIWECALKGPYAPPRDQVEARLQGFIGGSASFLDLCGTGRVCVAAAGAADPLRCQRHDSVQGQAPPP
jgi:DNA mismatch endonuclease (patch repair protein)